MRARARGVSREERIAGSREVVKSIAVAVVDEQLHLIISHGLQTTI